MQTQGCYTIVNRCLKLTHVFIFLAHFTPHPGLMDAIIFAAGRGERLRPLTDHCPKPLIEVLGLSLIEIHLYRLAEAGFSRVIINLHHLGQLIRDKLGNGQHYGLEIHYSDEPEEALETAGGIVHALPLLDSPYFAAISADILCDFNYSRLPEMAKNSRNGRLLLVNNPAHHPQGDFALDQDGHLLSQQQNQPLSCYTFSGIACFKRSLFEELQPGKRALRPVLESAIEHHTLYGTVYDGLWSDIGSLERLETARQSNTVAGYIASIKQSSS